jgi:prephenate dehydrogenase
MGSDPAFKGETVGIVGLGLIGGSIGLALRDPGRLIVGFDAHDASARIALDRLCVDRLVTFEEVMKADVVFLAVPPDVTVAVAERAMALAGEVTVVTDCSSVKTEVAMWAQKGKHARFVPGHPMAGHEKGGATYASSWMYRGARWILTPVKATASTSVRAVEALIKEMGAKPVRIEAAAHDRHVGTVSHLPHVLAAALVNLGESLESIDVAGGSWRDMTRVGGVDPDLWTQIMMQNRVELAKVLRDYEGNLSEMRTALENDNREGLRAILEKAHKLKAAQAPAEVKNPLRKGKR